MPAEEEKKRVFVVVLGDFGRSPRMQFHALSLAKNNFIVDVIGYGESTPHEEVMINQNINQHFLKAPPDFKKYVPQIFVYLLKVLWEFMTLMNILIPLPKPSYILVQNPPALPTLLVIWLYCCLFNVKWIIDWHNYGYTILALNLGTNHILVKIYKWVEQHFGKKATWNFCVTEAMRNDLFEHWDINALVLYDRPPSMFRPINIEEKHSLLLKLGEQYPILKSRNKQDEESEETRFTELINGTVREKLNRPMLLISSTSWTEDEDFNILLTALEKYEEVIKQQNHLPDIVCVVTGKGPLQSQFLKLIAEKNFCHIEIITPWLSAEDYPKLIACADLGVCLHISSSGLDLPMKVVDMFGCELPVCAINYKCLNELVKHGENGFVFNTSEELSLQIQELLKSPRDKSQLKIFHKNLQCYKDLRWDQTWENVALKVFR